MWVDDERSLLRKWVFELLYQKLYVTFKLLKEIFVASAQRTKFFLLVVTKWIVCEALVRQFYHI